MPRFSTLVCLISAVILCTALPLKAAQKAEVIHWWVSGGEAAALNVIIKEFERRGYTWIDTPVKSSYFAKSAAMARVFADNPPTAVQWHTSAAIQELYKNGLLRDISAIAQAGDWQKVLPEVIWRYATAKGKPVVVPLTLHGSNWFWASKKVLDDCGLKMPQTWSEFKRMLPIIKQKGYIPLALGGQPWQENLIFMAVALALGGKQFYMDYLVEHKPEALSGPTMVKALNEFASLRPYVDAKSPDRSWDDTNKLVIENKAAFFFMGDWAKGEFIQAGKKLGQDYLAALTPGSAPNYVAVSDCFAMLAVKKPKDIQAQAALAQVLMDPEVQRRFSLLKGCIPPRNDVPTHGFDQAARMAMEYTKNGQNVLPGINMANTEIYTSAFLDVIHRFWNDPQADPASYAKILAKAIKEAGI